MSTKTPKTVDPAIVAAEAEARVERVLTVPVTRLGFVGVLTDPLAAREELKRLLQFGEFVPRPEAETDTLRKQFIPYTVIRNESGDVFAYFRTPKGGENRLHGKRSIGVGGHVNPLAMFDPHMAYADSFFRELAEEVGLTRYDFECMGSVAGIINDDSDLVGRVHLGVVHVVVVPNGTTLTITDAALRSGGFYPPAALADSDLENWSRLALQML